MHDMTWFGCKGQISTKMHGENHKEGTFLFFFFGWYLYHNPNFENETSLRSGEYKNPFFRGRKGILFPQKKKI